MPHLAHTARAMLRIGWDLTRSVLRPVVIEHDLPEEDRPARHLVRRAGTLHPDDGSAPLTLVSWNIHRNYRPREVGASLAEILARERPDLLLLQEVPGAAEPLWSTPAVAELLDGWHLAYAPVHRVRRTSAYYPFVHAGLLTAARRPLDDVAVHELPTVTVPKLGPEHAVKRIALCTRIGWRGGALGVWNLHLENTSPPLGRWRQVERVLDVLDVQGDEHSVLMGDFNTLLGRRERLVRELARRGWHRPDLDRRRRLVPRVDHAFVRPPLPSSGRSLPHRGSDHRPILLRLE